MTREATKHSAVPIAMIVTGAALGAFLVLRKRQEIKAIATPERLADKCMRSLATLEQRITRIAS